MPETQALARFPIRLCVRETLPEALSGLVFAICQDAAKCACVEENTCLQRAYLSRGYLDAVQCKAVVSHADFLQMFPTVNFMVAVQLLSKFHLRTLVNLFPENILRDTQSLFMPPIDPMWLHGLFSCLSLHAGLVEPPDQG